jgi:uncharacterized membrane protein
MVLTISDVLRLLNILFVFVVVFLPVFAVLLFARLDTLEKNLKDSITGRSTDTGGESK